ncbi:translation initiation factor IF-2 [Rhodohalobacter halophilus]|uniref:translation initiation factor IF-2 n=1 Tax=Rhodohalobacter halophilus TaxID=1812810 RepID=UPI00083F6B08|nr:translation initiation factor IF-2 [Rhodohalobacter halophilus]
MTDQKPKKLFKVASEFNVATQSIVDTLSDNGFDVANRPNSKITPEMYDVLEGVYGDDKAKSMEHEKAREEYESRRNQILSSRNESVSIDSFLEPIDETLEPEDEEPEEAEQDVEEKSQEPSLEPQDETEEEDQQEEEAEEPEEEQEPVAKKESPDEAEDVEESDDDEDDEELEEDDSEEDEDSDEQDDDIDDEDDEGEEDDEDIDDDEDEDDEEESEEDESDEEEIIRGRSSRKLTGTKVVGKVEFSKEPRKKRKTRKRKKDLKDDGSDTKKKSLPAKEEKSSKKTKKSKKKGRRSRVDEEDVEKKMRETMQKMKTGDTVGSKRQKRRRQRKEEREEERQLQEEMEQLEDQILEVAEFITVSDLADELDVKPTDVITTCMNLGMMVSINQRLDASTIELVAAEYDHEVKFVDAEEMIEEEIEVEEDDPEDLLPRAPIITVMGHVDHGKTSLLDYIRKAKVAAGEAGGITQHVGAYEVVTEDNKKITFLDTPGHEAFTAMRSRGAQATDIVILVVAADDSVMPQTIEAINHAKAAGVSIVVAINKMDKPEANPDKIKQQLSEHGVIVEEYGGTNQAAEVSAHTGQGIDDLLEKVLIEAELLELKANPDRLAQGIVLESRVDKGKGTVANILVQNGTLKVGDPFVAGPVFGRVRAMENEHGQRLQEAGPSTPVQLIGFDGTPQAGDRLIVPQDEKTAKDVANQRQQIRREQSLRRVKHMTLDDLSRRMALGEVSELNIIIKADVDGSIEALSGALQKLSTEEVSVNIIHTGSGAITESDVLLASASDGIIIGFQVRPSAGARKLAEAESIDIRLFSVIYDAVDEVHDALEGMLSPEISEEMKAMVTVREVFKVSKVGTIAGCYVTEGKLNRNNPVRIIRDGVVIYDGEIDSLKRFKDDVKEVQAGYECGISIKGFNDIKVGDEFESYEVVEEKRSLDDAR